ncbi:MAG TPA: site-2 protease family protein [Pyrinomonadaceae bacterium]
MTFTQILHRQLRVARVYGIPVRIDYRWFMVFALSTWLIASNFEQGTPLVRYVNVSPSTAWVVGLVTTLGLFLSIFGHELSHALVGRIEGIETEEIVLHPFGGMARLSREPDNARAEFRIAVAGPASSFLFSVAAFGAMMLAAAFEQRLAGAVFFIIGFWNLMLAVFNLLPGYPLDGGRVLRAFLWHRNGKLEEATRIASLGGQLIAWTLCVFALLLYFKTGDLFMALWSVVVALFLHSAARSVGRDRKYLETVGEAMSAPIAVEPDVLVSHFLDLFLPQHPQEAFPVARGRRLHGILTLADVQKLPEANRHRTRVADVMRPVAPELFVDPATPLTRADALMKQNGAGALAVLDGAGELVGFLHRGRLKRRKETK